LNPAPTSYDANGVCVDGEICLGQVISIRVATANTGAANLTVNGLPSKSIVMPDGSNPPDNTLLGGKWYLLTWNATSWQITASVGTPGGGGGGDLSSAALQANTPLYCADSGTTDTFVCNLTPSLLAYTTGQIVWFKPNTNNTGTASININGLGQKTITTESDAVMSNDVLRAGYLYALWYDGNTFRVIYSSNVDPDPTNNEGKVITTEGVNRIYEARLYLPPDIQDMAANTTQINPLSSNVTLTASAARSLCNGAGVVTVGTSNGQWLYIYNGSAFTITFQDLAVCPGSALALGGSNVALPPDRTLPLQWQSTKWVRMDAPETASSGGAYKVSYSMPFCVTNGGGTTVATVGGWLGVNTNSPPVVALANGGRNCWVSFASPYTADYWINNYVMVVPDNWDGQAPKVYVVSRPGATAVVGQTLKALVGIGCTATDGSEDETPDFNTDTTLTMTLASTSAGRQYVLTGTAAATNCSAGELAAVRIKRDLAANETSTVTLNVNSVIVTWGVQP
jgi:hypothetical protein